MNRTRPVLLAGLTALVLVGAPTSARADPYKDEKLGYSFNYPSKWKRMPIGTGERWKVAEWQFPRHLEYGDPKSGQWTFHTPKLEVVIIPNSAAEQKGAEIEKTDKGIKIKYAAPWKDLKEYLDKTIQESGIGGFYFSKEEDLPKQGEIAVKYYEVTIDKLASAPRKVWGWAFYAEDAIYGITGDSLCEHEKKVKPDYEAAVKTFKIFQRTGALPGAAITGDDDEVIVTKDPSKEKVTDEELKKRRQEDFGRQLARIKETLQPGWKVKETEFFTAVTHADDKFTKEVLDHGEALRAWLDKNLGFVGNGYAGKVILWICADDNERNAMWSSMKWSPNMVEVVTCKDRDGWTQNRMWSLNSGIYGIWMRDKNRTLAWSLPPWLRTGLSSCVTTAVSKSGKVEFKAAQWDNNAIATLRRADKLMPARNFFTMDWEAMQQDYENFRQAEYFVRYLLVGSAQKNPKFKNVLSDYIKNMMILLDEQSDAKPEGYKEPENEQEEAAQNQRMQQEWSLKQKEVLDKLIQKTFPGWDEEEWKRFNTSYWKELGV